MFNYFRNYSSNAHQVCCEDSPTKGLYDHCQSGDPDQHSRSQVHLELDYFLSCNISDNISSCMCNLLLGLSVWKTLFLWLFRALFPVDGSRITGLRLPILKQINFVFFWYKYIVLKRILLVKLTTVCVCVCVTVCQSINVLFLHLFTPRWYY